MSGRQWTGSQILDAAYNFAHFLINDLKLNKGDVVCLFMIPNNDMTCVAILGVMAAGGIPCSANVDLTDGTYIM